MKQYLLFAGSRYYPCGGWNDFQGSFDSITEAIGFKALEGLGCDWWHVVDNETGTIVAYK